MIRVYRALAVFVVLLLLGLVGCRQAPAPAAKPPEGALSGTPGAKREAAPPPKEITIVQGVDVSSLDPYVESSVAARNIFYNLYGYLVLPIPTDPPEMRGELAESWQWLDDTTLRLKLRQGVKFHNGEPFDANSVKFSLQRILDPKTKSIWAAGLSSVQSINIVDPFTVDIVSKTPYAPLLAEVGRMVMMPPKYAQEAGDQQLALKPVGTGPYKFVEWVKGERVVLEANKDYWRGAPKIDKVTYRAVPEAATRVAELVTGRADIISDVPPEFEQQIQNAGGQVQGVRAPRVVYVGMDTRARPFDDKRVRQAVNYAVDVDSIIKNLMGNKAYRVKGPFGPNVLGYDPTIKGYDYNLDKAKQLLAEAGYPSGFSTTLTYGPGRFLRDKELAEAVAGELQKVGITTRLVSQEYGTYFTDLLAGKVTGMHLISWIAVTGDPDLVLKYLDSKRLGKYYVNPDIDKLIQSILTTTGQAKRLQYIEDTQQKVVDEAPWLFLFDLQGIWGMSKRITWKPLPNDLIDLKEIGGR